MENEAKQPISEARVNQLNIIKSVLIIAVAIAGGAALYFNSLGADQNPSSENLGAAVAVTLEEKVLPEEGITIPVRWGDFGVRMIEAGVIDQKKFEEIYAGRGGLSEEEKRLLLGKNNDYLKITPKNSSFVLNLLWGLGLGNKNEILEKGPMMDQRYGGAGNFASTGGWTLAKGEAMDHYSKHSFIVLNKEQQEIVLRVSQNIFRPCCGNSTYFPDCNHGMAMLALLELLASQNVPEDEMYKIALQVNSYWFPDTYLTIAKYLETEGVNWPNADPKEILGANYSSGRGFREILSKVEPVSASGGGGGCSV